MIARAQNIFGRTFEEFANYLDDPGKAGVTLLAVVVLIVLGAILHALFSWGRSGNRRSRRLFRRFAAASGLTREETELLDQIARRANLGEPSAIFFRRSAFEGFAAGPGADAPRVSILRTKVYGP